ncbi:MAG TPA: hypothetical protein VJ925_12240 [Longimicrobiales bacterium]|nr:hypothetical protein [Longimicrobiales bacterium]
MIRRIVLGAAYAAVFALVVISGVALVQEGRLFGPADDAVPDDDVVVEDPRRPVLLVPGWADEGERLAPLAYRLRTSGWDSTAVLTVNFEDPVGSNIDHAEEIRQAVDSLLSLNPGADEVDIVAHSMGGLATRWYMQHGGADTVRRFVSLAGPHRGTLVSLVAWGQGGVEMKPESTFLAELDSVLPESVQGFTIRTELETHIIPQESATLPGVPDTVLCCTMHWTLPTDATAIDVIVDFLVNGHPE